MDKSALGRMLLQANLLSPQELENLEKDSVSKDETLLAAVVRLKKLDYQQLAVLIATRFQLPYLDLDAYDLAQAPLSDIDLKILDKNKIFPLRRTPSGLSIACSDPTTVNLNDIKFLLAVAGSLQLIIVEENKLYSAIKSLLHTKGVEVEQEIDFKEDLATVQENSAPAAIQAEIDDAPIVRFIHATLLDAIRQKVSDIHFEPYEKMYRVRFRLDGALFSYKNIPAALKEKIASRIKVISQMDISEKRIPQDGRLKIKVSDEKSIDFRVSTLPTIYGEKIVMRILDSSAAALDIDKLGYSPTQKRDLLEAVRRPYGMVLVTGPTGSGKTVSLYSCLNILNQEDVNICTAEDPSEINLQGVNQVNMNEKAGLTFAATLKAFLRQDPDTILVGEIRDLETADIAIKAAQTGHMVLSTLHTNDAPKTITRLLNMGVKPFNIASSVILITAQRLVRKLCPSCKVVDEIPLEVLLESGLDPSELQGYGSSWHTYRPIGCTECNQKGYSGRVGVYQVMPVSEEIRKIILRDGTDIDIATQARLEGVLSLRESGLIKVKEGVTSLEEILASTNLD